MVPNNNFRAAAPDESGELGNRPLVVRARRIWRENRLA
jgi:hypothetical protein